MFKEQRSGRPLSLERKEQGRNSQRWAQRRSQAGLRKAKGHGKELDFKLEAVEGIGRF